jgi:hypothetical protein
MPTGDGIDELAATAGRAQGVQVRPRPEHMTRPCAPRIGARRRSSSPAARSSPRPQNRFGGDMLCRPLHAFRQENFMAENLMLYTAVYENVSDALEDLAAIEQLHRDDMIGKFDAAVIDQENGKPHIVKRVDRPHIRIIPEMFGGGALPRKELHEAAAELTSDDAGLIVIGEPTLQEGVDKAITRTSRVVKRSLDATTDELASELQEALKS